MTPGSGQLSVPLPSFQVPDAVGKLVGFEHEYTLARDGHPLDFRDLIHALGIPGLRLDPGDTNAYRLRSGLAITCDDAEAEVATPPLAVGPGFAAEIERWAASAREQLADLLPHDVTVSGYSTHISVALPGDGDRVAHLYARTFAPALALMMEGPESLGLYIRPRPGRLELCGEFIDGPRLGAVAAFAVGSVRACAQAVAGFGEGFPPPVRVQLLPCEERYGLRIRRGAYGTDLYSLGRTTPLDLAAGGVIEAQSHMELAWQSARRALCEDASPPDLAYAEAMCSGFAPLGVEDSRISSAGWANAALLPCAPPTSEHGAILDPRDRPGFSIAAFAATWDWTIFALSSDANRRFVSVPRDALSAFVESLDAGSLDDVLRAELSQPRQRRILQSHAQTRSVGVYDAIPSLQALLPQEREPSEPPLEPAEVRVRHGKVTRSRPGKTLMPFLPVVPRTIVLEPAPPPPALPTIVLEPAPPPAPVPPMPLDPPRAIPLPEHVRAAPGRPWFIALGIAAVAIVVAGAFVVPYAFVGTNEGRPSPTSEPAPTRPVDTTPAPPTQRATDVPRTPTSAALATAMPPSATAVPGAATALPPTAIPQSPAATATVAGTIPPTSTPAATTPTSPPLSTATVRPTETPQPTATATASLTPTPSPTVRPTETPRPTATAMATASPTRTPIPVLPIDVPPPPPPGGGCIPLPGATC